MSDPRFGAKNAQGLSGVTALAGRRLLGKRRSLETRRVARLNGAPPGRGQQPTAARRTILAGGPQPQEAAGDGVSTLLGG